MDSMEKSIDEAIFNTVSPMKNLPEYVFLRRYDEFYFFDTDISADEEFIQEIERGWKLMPPSERPDVFLSYSSKNEAAIRIDASQDWIAVIGSFKRKLIEGKLYGGIILMPENGGWAVFQKTPVDLGVLAVNSNEFGLRAGLFRAIDKNWLIDSNQILNGLTDPESKIRTALGITWLEELAINYGMMAEG